MPSGKGTPNGGKRLKKTKKVPKKTAKDQKRQKRDPFFARKRGFTAETAEDAEN
jgi:hypothetical protein